MQLTLQSPDRKKTIILFVVCLTVLFLSFNFNIFHAVNHTKFLDYANDSEALVLGRMVKSQNDGIFSSNAFMGRYMELEGDFNLNQRKLYAGQLVGGHYEEYLSQIGMQGIILSAIDSVFIKLNMEPGSRLALYRGTTSLLFALSLSIIMIILYFDIGLEATCFLLASIALSKWQVYIGKNLYWMTYTLFLPMVTVLVALKLEEWGRQFNIIWIALLVMLFVFIKATMGYEYISTVLLAMIAPLVYFATKNSWSASKLIRRCFVIGSSGLLGFMLAVSLHIHQLSLTTGSTDQAIDIIQERVLARTQTDPESYAHTLYYDSQKASTLSMLFNQYMLRGGSYRLKIPYLFWIGIFMYITYKVYKDKYEIPELQKTNTVVKALIYTTWFSILAPLSWFILAKSHSYIHIYLNHILWHVPFMLFGCALLGYILTPKLRKLSAMITSIFIKFQFKKT